MPAKKKGAKKGGKKKKAARAKATEERDQAMLKMRRFLKAYPTHCAAADSTQSPGIMAACRESLDEEKIFTKFVLEVFPESATIRDPKSAGTARTRQKSASGKPAATASTSTAEGPPILPSIPTPPITLPPLFRALTEVSYDYMRCLHVWSIPVNDDGAVSIALFMESPIGWNLKVLELRSTNLSNWALVRLARPLAKVHLTQLNLDYNEIPCDVLTKFCDKLQTNGCLQTLSLNYCKLDHTCGEVLGGYIAVSQIRSLSLVGNSLQCNGCNELIRPLVTICESSSFNAIKLDTDMHKKEDDLVPSRAAESAPEGGEPSSRSTALPPLCRLDLRDNAIDAHGVSGNETQTFEPVVCMRTVKRWMISNPGIEELNLDHNLISDGGARELLQGLILRKEAGLPIMKVVVTVYISQDTFQMITEYSSPPKRRKGKGKKKKT